MPAKTKEQTAVKVGDAVKYTHKDGKTYPATVHSLQSHDVDTHRRGHLGDTKFTKVAKHYATLNINFGNKKEKQQLETINGIPHRDDVVQDPLHPKPFYTVE